MRAKNILVVAVIVASALLPHQKASATMPSTGTSVSWTNDTYFNSFTSQSNVLNSDLTDTNSLVWQLFYAHAPLSLPVDGVLRVGINTYQSGNNTVQWRVAISSSENTIGNFGLDSQFAQGSYSYSTGGFNQATIATAVSIPARRYFLIGVNAGPYYRSFKQLASNRSAQINSLNYVTALNTIYYASHASSVNSGVPVALGGASNSFTTYSGYVPVISIKFKATGTPAAPALSTPDTPTVGSISSTAVVLSSQSTVTNAQSYVANLYQSNGTTFIESQTVTTSQVTNGFNFSGLSPNTSYRVGFIAVGDGVSHGNSALSPLALFSTEKGSTSVGLTFSESIATFGTPITITAQVFGISSGIMTFNANSKKIPRCTRKPVVSSTVVCSWKPATRGVVNVVATFTPSSTSFISSFIATPILVQNRKSLR